MLAEVLGKQVICVDHLSHIMLSRGGVETRHAIRVQIIANIVMLHVPEWQLIARRWLCPLGVARRDGVDIVRCTPSGVRDAALVFALFHSAPHEAEVLNHSRASIKTFGSAVIGPSLWPSLLQNAIVAIIVILAILGVLRVFVIVCEELGAEEALAGLIASWVGKDHWGVERILDHTPAIGPIVRPCCVERVVVAVLVARGSRFV
mmetsp:Transcript_71965/g.119827  ORF Transcript_71965/g.119827 Transcript_71965/m.119827 type:complete len:205 (+) Transcript_71965:873-1487(+)